MSEQDAREDEDANATGQTAAGLDRRALLGGMAGGCLLGAGGLLLAMDEDAAAGKKHHRQRKQRKRRRQKARCGYKEVSFQFHNDFSTTAKVEFWVREHDSFNGWHFLKLDAATVAANGSRTFAPGGDDEGKEAFLWIDDKYCIDAFNPIAGFPAVTLGYSGQPQKYGGWTGGTKVVDFKSLSENESADMTVDGRRFFVERTDDSCDFKNFTVQILPA